jgi:hypothetical protein
MTMVGATGIEPVGGDPVAIGLVTSLARPEGNVTGFTKARTLAVQTNQFDRLPALAADLVRPRRRPRPYPSPSPPALTRSHRVLSPASIGPAETSPAACFYRTSWGRNDCNWSTSCYPMLRGSAFSWTRAIPISNPTSKTCRRLQLVILNARTDSDLETAFATSHNSMLVRSWSAPAPSTSTA